MALREVSLFSGTGADDMSRVVAERICLAVLAFTLVLPMGSEIRAYDTGWHLRLGEWIWQHGRLPEEDPLSSAVRQGAFPGLTEDQEQLPDEYLPISDHFAWLAQLALYGLERVGGLGGLLLFRAACLLGLTAGSWAFMTGLGVPRIWRLAGATCLAFWIGPLVLVRPSAISIVLVAWLAAAWWLAIRKSDPRLAVVCALLPVPWAHVHGGFFLGWCVNIAFLVGALVERRLPESWPVARHRPLPGPLVAVLIPVAVVAPFALHPTGWERALRSLAAVSEAARLLAPIPLSGEMTPPTFDAQPFTFVMIGCVLLVQPLLLRRWGAGPSFLSLGATAMALLAARNATFLAVTALPLVVAAASSVTGRGRERGAASRLDVGLPVALCVAVGFSGVMGLVDGSATWSLAWRSEQPVELARFLELDPPPGKPFNSYNQGSFLDWAASRSDWIIDGRFNNPRFVYTYLKFRRSQGARGPEPLWRRFFEHYERTWALIPVVENVPDIELIVLLSRAPDWWWTRVEDRTIVFVQGRSESAAYLRRHRLSAPEVRGRIGELTPVVVELGRTAGPLLVADFLASAGLFDAAHGVLSAVGASDPLHSGAAERLRRWPAYVSPVAHKLAVLPGGETDRELVAELERASGDPTTPPGAGSSSPRMPSATP